MKFEGLVFKPTGNEPPEMSPFLQHYSLVNRFLQAFNTQKLTVADNVASFNLDITLSHGITTQIPHKLGYIPKTVQSNGRVEFIEIVENTAYQTKIKPKLLTANIVSRPSSDRVQVTDASFFRQNDLVKIGVVVLKVKGIDNDTIILEGTPPTTASVVSLSIERCKLFII